jgi:hypothetical protein
VAWISFHSWVFGTAFNAAKSPKRAGDFQAELTTSTKSLIKKAGENGLVVSAIGVGFAGSVDSSSNVVRSAPNIPELKGFSFKKALAHLGHVEVSLHNDAHAALYGELKLGAAAGYKHVIGIFIGTSKVRSRSMGSCIWAPPEKRAISVITYFSPLGLLRARRVTGFWMMLPAGWPLREPQRRSQQRIGPRIC